VVSHFHLIGHLTCLINNQPFTSFKWAWLFNPG
jgi:hypothetical protein